MISIALEILTVHPAHQGRGIGRQLLQWGTEQADHHGVRMVCESTVAGLALYQWAGFVERDFVQADMREFGYVRSEDPEEGMGRRVWMVREPKRQWKGDEVVEGGRES